MAAAATNVGASAGLTPASSACTDRLTAKAAASPIATPIAGQQRRTAQHQAEDRAAVAPNAMRTPISCVRDATTNDSRPWMPRQASSTAMPANAASAHNCTERDVVSSPTMSLSIRTSETGCAGSALATAARTAAATGPAAPAVRTTRSFGA